MVQQGIHMYMTTTRFDAWWLCTLPWCKKIPKQRMFWARRASFSL